MPSITVNESQIYGGNSDHDGIGQSSSYNFYFDRTLNAAANDATADGQIDSTDIDNVIDGAFDMDQITEREARAFVRWGEANYDKMSPEARKKFELIQATLVKTVGHELSDGLNAHFKGHGDTLAMDKAGIDALKAKLAEIGAPKSDSSAKAPPSDGIDEPAEPEPAPESSQSSGAPAPTASSAPANAPAIVDVPDFAHMDWDQIIAFIRRLIGDKEVEAKNSLRELGVKLGKAQAKVGKNDEEKAKNTQTVTDIQNDMSELQSFMKKIDEMTTMLTNMEKARHETLMTIIRAIAA